MYLALLALSLCEGQFRIELTGLEIMRTLSNHNFKFATGSSLYIGGSKSVVSKVSTAYK